MLLLVVLNLLLAQLSVQACIPRDSNPSCSPSGFGPLQFSDQGTFQLSIFEDLHFGENAWDSWGPQQDINSLVVMNTVLDNESPNLVVLNGDLITGENAYLFNSTVYVDEIVGPLLERCLTWASTYGNHDSQYNLSSQAIYAREHQWSNSRTAQMVTGADAGVTNYYLPVYPSGCDPSSADCLPSLILWFFDSRGGVYFQELNSDGNTVGRPDWVDTSVVDWFYSTNAQLVELNGDKAIPSLAFVHIPTNASLALQQSARGVNPSTAPGVNDDNPLAQQAQGWCADGSNDCAGGYGGQDIPFMQALTSVEGVMAVFSGHDHGDTWCYKWEGLVPGMTVAGNGINVCFGQHSGYGGYGNWIRGARQVLVSEEMLQSDRRVAQTWIRLEDGSVVGNVMLNETYGQDVYPQTPDQMTYCPTCNYSVVTPMPGT